MNFCQSVYFCFLEELRDDYNAELFVGTNETVRTAGVSVKRGSIVSILVSLGRRRVGRPFP